MSDPLEARIGEVLLEVDFPIEAGKIREFAAAIGDKAPLDADASNAESGGRNALSAPPTFTVAAAFYVKGGMAAVATGLGLDLKRLLHGSQGWTYHRPVLAGSILHCVSRLESVAEQKMRSGSAMRVVTVRTDYVNAADEPVVSEVMTMLELPPAG